MSYDGRYYSSLIFSIFLFVSFQTCSSSRGKASDHSTLENTIQADEESRNRMGELIKSNLVPIFPDLTGKVALVTGSSRGIGAETARFLAINKVKVIINGRDIEAIKNVVNEIKINGGEAIGYAADCTDYSQIEEMKKGIDQAFGKIDLLFAFAGSSPDPKPIEELSEERWDSVFTNNLKSKVLTVKAFIPSMKQSGRGGAIVIMCSSAGRLPSSDAYDYSSAHAAIALFTNNLAQQLGRYDIRVNAVAPCTILTELFKKETIEKYQAKFGEDAIVSQEMRREILDKTERETGSMYTIPRMGKPCDVASASLFLSSEAASWITGTVLDVNGGGKLQISPMAD